MSINYNKYLCKYFFTCAFFALSFLSNAQIKAKAISIDSLMAKVAQNNHVQIINFWSTWCKPCIAEIPGFLNVIKTFKKDSVELQFVSQDTKKLFLNGSLNKFINNKKWTAKHYWLTDTNADYYCPKVDSSWSGVIPVTLILNNKTGYKAFYEQPLSKTELVEAIKKSLAK